TECTFASCSVYVLCATRVYICTHTHTHKSRPNIKPKYTLVISLVHTETLPSATVPDFRVITTQPDVVTLTVWLQRSPAPRGSAGRGRCGLRQVQVKVSELGLGYLGQEELVFRYCSGRCLNSITNYDRILTRLAASRRSVLQGAPPTACCRPTAYERHLAFLDDDLLYHIVRKHSARRCGCV
uniref:TGF-beta family profile domain-containing protein n=1 Tax=Pygocentrus nattereri TaxID=42514 RepID=A0A3B4DVZ2_PYGNA